MRDLSEIQRSILLIMIICELDLLLFFIFGNQIHFVKRAILLIIDLLLYCPLVEIKLLL